VFVVVQEVEQRMRRLFICSLKYFERRQDHNSLSVSFTPSQVADDEGSCVFAGLDKMVESGGHEGVAGVEDAPPEGMNGGGEVDFL
jgi:hypothetical protein